MSDSPPPSTPKPPTTGDSNNEQVSWSVTLKNYFWVLVKDIFDLDKGVNKNGVIREIKSKQSMSGANAWMLFCSIIIASIGLNLDSQAVIIGAMLISPLMSPILGIGLGVAINDRDALYHALMHFGAAILIALIASTVYFCSIWGNRRDYLDCQKRYFNHIAWCCYCYSIDATFMCGWIRSCSRFH